MVRQYQALNFEIWILGDFNADILKRTDPGTITILRFVKKLGQQLMDEITRPNKKKGNCIDLIMTDSNYVSEYGTFNDYVSDHYSIFCIRKKSRERRDVVLKAVRDYRAFDEANLNVLLNGCDWCGFDTYQDPDIQWEIMLKYVNDILAIMCPYKMVTTRKHVTPWLNPDIYKAIKDKQNLVKAYKTTKNPDNLSKLRKVRNKINTMIEKAKSDYIKTTLQQTVKKPKIFWKLIKCLIDPDDCVDITSYTFRNLDDHDVIPENDVPDFLNNYFVNIAERTVRPENIVNRTYTEL